MEAPFLDLPECVIMKNGSRKPPGTRPESPLGRSVGRSERTPALASARKLSEDEVDPGKKENLKCLLA